MIIAQTSHLYHDGTTSGTSTLVCGSISFDVSTVAAVTDGSINSRPQNCQDDNKGLMTLEDASYIHSSPSSRNIPNLRKGILQQNLPDR